MSDDDSVLFRQLVLDFATADDRDVGHRALARIRKLGGHAIPYMMDELNSSSAELRRHAAFTLGFLGVFATSAVPRLVQLLEDEDQSVRHTAFIALQGLGPVADGFLCSAMQLPNPTVRIAAADAVRDLNHDRELVTVLSHLLKDGDGDARSAALRAMSRLCKPPRGAVTELFAAFRNSDDENEHHRIVLALDGISRAGMREVIGRLSNPDPSARELAAVSFVRMPWADPDRLEALARVATTDPVDRIRQVAMFSLGRVGVHAAQTIKQVLAATTDKKVLGRDPTLLAEVEIAYEKMRSELESLIGIPLKHLNLRLAPIRRGRRRKRFVAEVEKSLVAILDTCVDWDGEDISIRKLLASELLRSRRREFGLPTKVTIGTLSNHLDTLARLCELPSILEPNPKRKPSRFRDGARDKLRSIRPVIEQIRLAEEAASTTEGD